MLFNGLIIASIINYTVFCIKSNPSLVYNCNTRERQRAYWQRWGCFLSVNQEFFRLKQSLCAALEIQLVSAIRTKQLIIAIETFNQLEFNYTIEKKNPVKFNFYLINTFYPLIPPHSQMVSWELIGQRSGKINFGTWQKRIIFSA